MNLTNDSNTSNVPKPGIPHGDHHFFSPAVPGYIWPFAGTDRFLAALFTFLSRLPVVNRLSAQWKELVDKYHQDYNFFLYNSVHCLS